MDLKEIKNFSSDTYLEECKHWWIATRFHYINRAIEYLSAHEKSPNFNIDVLEFGCGTGQNLYFLRHLSPHRRLINQTLGYDLNLTNSFSPSWKTNLDKFTSAFQPGGKKFELVLGMDVLEHIDDDLAALQDWKKSLGPQSLILITVPAFQSLWSYHDEVLEHKRRYTKRSLLEVTQKAGLEPVFINYAFGPFFPLVFLVRKFLGNKKKTESDLKLPPSLVNNILHYIGKVEALYGGNSYFGTSVVGLFKLAPSA